jgi:hypothetical protein
MVDTSKKHDSVNRPIISQRRRQTWVTTLLGAAILLSGVGIGLGSAMTYLSSSKETAAGGSTQQQPEDPSTQQRSDAIAKKITDSMHKKCKFDDQQKAKIREMLTSRMTAIHEIHSKAMDDISVIHTEISDSMKELLTEDQFARWKKHTEEARKRWSRHHYSRGRHRGGDRDGRGKYGSPMGPEMFKRVDKNGDDVLDENEIKGAHEKLQKMLKWADTNKDGKVERKEFESKFRRRRPSSSKGSQSPRGPMRKPHDRPESKPADAPKPDMSMLMF